MKNIARRQFIKTSILAGASLGVLPRLPAQSRVVGANGDIRVAVIGFNGRGENLINGLRKIKGTRLVALCDVDKNVLERGVQKCRDRGEQVEGFVDFRKLLESKDIDAVGFATPNHWHALNAIWSAQAGKDVYLEKPVSHNVWEGRKIVEASRKYNRIVQTGTQMRSNPAIREAIAWLHEGNIGKILRARGLCYKRRASLGKASAPVAIPDSLDFDLWCGPARMEAPTRSRLHYDWHWVWETGNGDLGNQGVHQMDVARWALGENELSPEVFSIGGRLGYEDDGNTPNTLVTLHNYKRAPLIFEVRGLPENSRSEKMDQFRGASVGVVVDCEGGSLVIPTYSNAKAFDKSGSEIKSFSGAGDHYENFIQAVRSRKHGDLNADILEGHISAALCHISNTSYRAGKNQSPERIRDEIKNNRDAAEAFSRIEEHLLSNNVDLRNTPLTLGAVLKVDSKREIFTNNKDANRLLKRDYRKPFVVPDVV